MKTIDVSTDWLNMFSVYPQQVFVLLFQFYIIFGRIIAVS